MARSHNCPFCGRTDTFRVPRKPKEYLLLGYRAFSCGDCKGRYLMFEAAKLLQWRSAS
jgi:transcriptional regulator NrdR family protein